MMEENNQKSQFGGALQPYLAVFSSGIPKLIVAALGIFVVLTLVGFLVYRSYFVQHPGVSGNLPGASAPIVQEQIPKAGYVIYRDTDTAISFQYPETFFLVDKDKDGYKMAPRLASPLSSSPAGVARELCETVDCIKFLSEIYTETVWPKDMSASFASDVGSSPIGIYQDETGSKPFRINGAEAVRYYEVSRLNPYWPLPYGVLPATPALSYGRRAGTVYTIPLLNKYILEEHILINDPYFSRRIITLTYRELNKDLPIISGQRFLAEALDGVKILKLFDQERHRSFLDLADSVKILPIDWDAFTAHSSEKFNISFQAPKYWGHFLDLANHANHASFRSPLGPGLDLVPIFFGVAPPPELNCCMDDKPTFSAYSGQSLDDACRHNAFIDISNYDVRIDECNLRTLPSGIKTLIVKGTFADMYRWYEEYGELQAIEIPPTQRQYLRFKAALLQLKSSVQPGLATYFFEDDTRIVDDIRKLDFDSVEKIFDRIINSLSYAR